MWIEESVRRSKRMKDQFVVNKIQVFIKDMLPPGVSPEFIFDYV